MSTVTHKEVTKKQISFLIKELFLNYVSENKTLVAGLIIMTFLTFPVESIILPRFYSILFDKVREQSSAKSRSSLPPLNIKNPLRLIQEQTPIGIIITILLIWVFLLIGYAIKSTFHARVTPEYLSFLRQKILGETIKSHKENYQDLKIGKHISRLLDFTRSAKDIVGFSIGDLLPVLVGSLSIVVYFFTLDKTIGFTVFAGLSLLLIYGYYVGQKCIDASCDREGYYLEMSEDIHDSLGNLMNVYLNNQEGSEISKNKQIEKRHTELYKEQQLLMRDIVFTQSIISVITFISVFLISYHKLQTKQISTKVFSTIVMILMYFFGYLMNLSDNIPYYLTKIGILKQSVPFLSSILSNRQHGTKKRVINRGKIEFKKISYRYPKSDSYLYHKLSLEIRAGEHVGVMGSSGSGKTTLMKLLIRMFPLTSGSIYIDNTDIETMDVGYLRREVNYINQKTILFNDTIINNIKYGNPKLSDARIKSVIKQYKLDTVYQEIEKGLYGNAGVHGGNLSLGMQKITILLRGIFRGGKIMIFDEPLAGLDSNTRSKFISLMNDMFKSQTVIVITHDPEIIPHMDRVIDLSKLKITHNT